MAVHQAAWLHDGNGRQFTVLDVIVEIGGVLDVSSADSGVFHDRRVVLKRIADSAIFVGILADGTEIELIRIVYVVVPLIAIVLPGNILGDHLVANAPEGRRWNREDGVIRVRVDKGIVAVAEVARVVIVKEVVVPRLAPR